MKDNIKFQDVAIVSFDSAVGGKKVVYGLTDSTSINHVVNSSELRGGISNIYIDEVYESKDLEITVTPTIGNFSLMAAQTKNLEAFTSGNTVSVPYTVTAEAVDNVGAIEIDLSNYTPLLDEVVVLNIDNEIKASTFATGTITITDGVAGDIYNVTFLQEETTADVLEIDGKDYPETVENLTLETIGYDPETGAIAGRLFIVCDYAKPDGNFTLDLATATNSTFEVKFKAKPKFLGTRLAKIIWVPAV
jgi:hypothetical protein